MGLWTLACALAPGVAFGIAEASWRPRMERLVRSGSWPAALALLEEVRDAGGEVSSGGWSAALVACARARPASWEAAIAILARVPAPCAKCYTAAIRACSGRWQAALQLFSQMRAAGLPRGEHALTACLGSLAEAAMWEEAIELFRATPMTDDNGAPVEADVRTVNAVLMACARAGRPSEADSFYREHAAGGVSDSVTHYALVLARLRAGQHKRALHLVSSLRQRGLPLDPTAFLTLLRDADQRAAPHDALAAFSEMVAAGFTPKEEAMRLALGTAVAHPSAWRKAIRTLQALQPQGVGAGADDVADSDADRPEGSVEVATRPIEISISVRLGNTLMKRVVEASPVQWQSALALLGHMTVTRQVRVCA